VRVIGFRWLIIVLAWFLAGCAASLPEIPSRESGTGLIDVLHWQFDPDSRLWHHAAATEILDSADRKVWSSENNRIDIPRYTPGLDRSWQATLPAGNYTILGSCYSLRGPEYPPPHRENMPARNYKLRVVLPEGHYVSIVSSGDRFVQFKTGQLNDRVYLVPHFAQTCRVDAYVHKGK